MHAIVIQADAAGDKVRVKTRLAGCANQVGEITPAERFASGETDLQDTERGRFTNYARPFIGSQFAIVSCLRRV